MKTYRIATIPVDGIGREVIPAGEEVLRLWHLQTERSNSSLKTLSGEGTIIASMTK